MLASASVPSPPLSATMKWNCDQPGLVVGAELTTSAEVDPLAVEPDAAAEVPEPELPQAARTPAVTASAIAPVSLVVMRDMGTPLICVLRHSNAVPSGARAGAAHGG